MTIFFFWINIHFIHNVQIMKSLKKKNISNLVLIKIVLLYFRTNKH